MADHKSWLWRKRSSEKTTVMAEKVDLESNANEEQIHLLVAEKKELERDLRDLSNKLSSALAECDAKDDLAEKHAKTAKEALAGWEKAEAKALSLNQELDEALKQRNICEERKSQLDSALKECMQQLHFVRQNQEQRIHDVLLKASKELEETKMFMEKRLEESGNKIATLTARNSQLDEMLLLKEQLIEDLNQQMAKADEDVNALLARLEHMEKENNSLIYEVRVLEKEVDIRNEEQEFNRRTADATHKQHLENVKKIAKLESECQRLRVLVRKRLPGPAALSKMKSEVDMLQRDSVDSRRRKSNSSVASLQFDYAADNYPESPGRRTNLLTDRICALEDENKSLRETLQKNLHELQISRNMYIDKASKLSQIEAQLKESPKNQLTRDTKSSPISHGVSLASMSDIGSDDKVSCSGSSASALMSELEQFRDEKDKVVLSSKSVRISDINHFMDDFAEMEKLALVCVDKPMEISVASISEGNLSPLSVSTGKELVPVGSVDGSVARVNSNSPLPSKLRKSVLKLIEIIESINLPSQDYDASQTPSRSTQNCFSHKNSETRTGYVVRVFQWRTSELGANVQNLLRTCDDLLNGNVNFDIFTEELASVLEWIINHCFSLQDVSSMKDAIKKQLEWETRSESETEAGEGTLSLLKEKLVRLTPGAANDYPSEVHREMGDEGRKMEDAEKDMSCIEQIPEVHSAVCDCESLRQQLQNSESTITSLQAELEALKQSRDMIEDQFEKHKMTVKDFNSQLVAVKSEADEAQQNIASLEAELKNKAKHCEELEAKCLDFQIHLQRVKKMDTTENVIQDEKQLRNEMEISAASEKLAECQETILHLGKQLRTLAATHDAVVSDKFISTPTNTASTTTLASEKNLTSQRSSLLDQMQAEDDDEADQLESPETKEIISAKNFSSEPSNEDIRGYSKKNTSNETAPGALAIVPSKRQQTSGGLFKKLLWRKRKSSSKKIQLPF